MAPGATNISKEPFDRFAGVGAAQPVVSHRHDQIPAQPARHFPLGYRPPFQREACILSARGRVGRRLSVRSPSDTERHHMRKCFTALSSSPEIVSLLGTRDVEDEQQEPSVYPLAPAVPVQLKGCAKAHHRKTAGAECCSGKIFQRR